MPEVFTYDKIISDIEKGKVSNLYLFYGPEKFLIKDVLSRMEKRLVNPGLKNINLIKLDGQRATFDSIINACETLPFMDEKKIVIIDDCSFLQGKQSQGADALADSGVDELCKYLQGVPEFTVLVLIAGDDVDKRKKIFGCVKKYGIIVEFQPLKKWELQNWIMLQFEEKGKRISKADALYMAERLPSNLESLSGEINKLLSYAGHKSTISREDIDAVIPKSIEMNIFQLVDCLSSKNCGKAIYILNDMLLNSEPVPLILTMIMRQYRLLMQTKLLLEKGYGVSEISSKLSVMNFVARELIKFSANYDVEEIEKKLKCCLETDRAIKTGKCDGRIALESLIVKLSKTD